MQKTIRCYTTVLHTCSRYSDDNIHMLELEPDATYNFEMDESGSIPMCSGNKSPTPSNAIDSALTKSDEHVDELLAESLSFSAYHHTPPPPAHLNLDDNTKSDESDLLRSNHFSPHLDLLNDEEYDGEDEDEEIQGEDDDREDFMVNTNTSTSLRRRPIKSTSHTYSRSPSKSSSLAHSNSKTILEEIWLSIFEPGLNSKMVKIMDVCFYALFVSLVSLGIATGGNIHVVALLGIAVCLFVSVKWYIFLFTHIFFNCPKFN